MNPIGVDVVRTRERAKGFYEAMLPMEGIYYHTWEHVEQVERGVREIGVMEGISWRAGQLLLLATYFHDVCNLIQREGHEERGAQLAHDFLSARGLSAPDAKAVASLIRVTAEDVAPKTLFEEILCDADLSMMGSPDAPRVVDGFRRELGIEDLHEWNKVQAKFYADHQWHTDAARELYDEQKHKNLEYYVAKVKYGPTVELL